MSLSRQLRRAAERTARKLEQKAARQTPPAALAASSENGLPHSAEEPAVLCATTLAAAVPEPEQQQRKGATGPRTIAGKAIASLNHLKHGLTGAFRVLQFESQSDFNAAHDALIAEHNPATPTESELVRRMMEHAWLSRRAQLLQDAALNDSDDSKLSLYMRYQTTNDRGFRACLNDLLRLRREQRAAAREFESQNRQAELHDARVRTASARASYAEFEADLKSAVDAPLPGYSSIPLEQVKDLFKTATLAVQPSKAAKTAA